VLASGGVLVLFKTIGEKLKTNKDNIISLVEATKKAASDKVFMPTFLPISDELLENDELVD
ncbi:22745_t:CDS:1, partial [Racocetra persica]